MKRIGLDDISSREPQEAKTLSTDMELRPKYVLIVKKSLVGTTNPVIENLLKSKSHSLGKQSLQIHLEVARDVTTNTCIKVISNFIARRGRLVRIRSDNWNELDRSRSRAPRLNAEAGPLQNRRRTRDRQSRVATRLST